MCAYMCLRVSICEYMCMYRIHKYEQMSLADLVVLLG